MPHGFTKLGKLPIVSNGQNHVPIGGGEILVGHRVGVGIAHALRQLPTVKVVHALVRENRDLGVEERHVDVAALARGVAALEGGRLSRHFLPVAYLQALSDPANQRFLERLRRSQGAAATASDAAVEMHRQVRASLQDRSLIVGVKSGPPHKDLR